MKTRLSTSHLLLALAFFGSSAVVSSPTFATGPHGDPGFVQFRGASFPVHESDGAAVVVVRRHRGTSGEVSVDFQTHDGTALAGEDYTAAAGTLTWAAGDGGDKTIAIEILADDVAEGLETFGVALSNPTGGVEVGTLAETVVRVLPQDGGGGDPVPPASRIRLRSAIFPAFESAGAATFVVVRQGDSAGPANVDYSTFDGSATAGADYTTTAGTLNWADGETGAKSVTVPLIDDTIAERQETVSIVLTNAVGGELGGRDTASILILDDDHGGQDACVSDEETMCLANNRFALRGTWTDFQGGQGVFRAVPSTDESGLFWFFDESNMEVLVKVVDGCALNNHRWLFFAATTNVAYTFEVTDLRTGAARTYTNPLGTRAPATTDVDAFLCSP